MSKEDYNIIAPDNKIWNHEEYIKHDNLNNNISDNPYPVMYVEGKPVYEGDTLIFTDSYNKSEPTLRTIYFQNRYHFTSNKKWGKQFSWSIKPKQR